MVQNLALAVNKQQEVLSTFAPQKGNPRGGKGGNTSTLGYAEPGENTPAAGKSDRDNRSAMSEQLTHHGWADVFK